MTDPILKWGKLRKFQELLTLDAQPITGVATQIVEGRNHYFGVSARCIPARHLVGALNQWRRCH